MNLNNGFKDSLPLLEKVIRFKKLLFEDGFNPRISRKIANTQKSSTLKYDIILLSSHKTRQNEISFIKRTFFQYITYREKKSKIIKLEKNIGKTKK
ncbi:MAG: hypothetical protein KAT77_00225 [Nanoarchaeota archaeon]|nr:hypothetical protein [Nanoarchaeota archaeon]